VSDGAAAVKVYVVNYGWDYEGESTEGVYSSPEKAREAIKVADASYVDKIVIYEVEIDAPMAAKKTKVE
jgi:hypothetical protein